jgi:hypothetical protein
MPARQVGVDAHLAAGHGVEGEPGRDFRDAARALRDHHEVDHDEDQEDHQADDDVAADHEVAERRDHLPGVAGAQDQPGAADVEPQPQQRDQQQQAREDAELERVARRHRDQQHHDAERERRGQQRVEQERRQRHDQQRHDHHHADREQHLAVAGDHAHLPRRTGRHAAPRGGVRIEPAAPRRTSRCRSW